MKVVSAVIKVVGIGSKWYILVVLRIFMVYYFIFIFRVFSVLCVEHGVAH